MAEPDSPSLPKSTRDPQGSPKSPSLDVLRAAEALLSGLADVNAAFLRVGNILIEKDGNDIHVSTTPSGPASPEATPNPSASANDRVSQPTPRRRQIKRPVQEGSVSAENIVQSVRATHVSFEDSQWLVRKTGTDRVRQSFLDKEKALSFGKSTAKKHSVDLFLHDQEGRVTQVDLN